jgi:hypothetical protein
LRLAPRALPWSRVFHQEVTLGLPVPLAEALPALSAEAIRRGVMAHMCGILAAFGADRIDDGQVEATPSLRLVLSAVRSARDAAIDSFDIEGAGPLYDYRAADLATARANRVEQEFLAIHDKADFGTYERLSVPKQYLVFPAAMTLARAAGLDEDHVESVRAMCLAMAMGLQLRDDATDWMDDHAEGRAWAVRIYRGTAGALGDGVRNLQNLHNLQDLQSGMATTGTIVSLLRGAAGHFQSAVEHARFLGAARVAAWAEKNRALTAKLAEEEARSPGHIVRWEIERKQARTANPASTSPAMKVAV